MRGLAPVIALSCKRRTRTSTALMPNARARRRGQAPQPRSGAPIAQGLRAATRSAAQSGAPSFASGFAKSQVSTDGPNSRRSFITPRIYTSLTGTTDTLTVSRSIAHRARTQHLGPGRPFDRRRCAPAIRRSARSFRRGRRCAGRRSAVAGPPFHCRPRRHRQAVQVRWSGWAGS